MHLQSSHPKYSGWKSYALAIGCVLVATVICWASKLVIGSPFPFMTFVLATLISAFYGGTGPGLVALLAGAILGDSMFLAPLPGEHHRQVEIMVLLTYSVTTLASVWLIGALRREHRRAHAAAARAHEHSQQLEQEMAERQRVQESLRQSEQRLRVLLETVPQGVYECDTQGRITFTNDAFQRIAGCDKAELLKMHIWDPMLPGPQKEALPGLLEQLVREQPSPTPYVGQNLTKDGRVIDVQVDWTYKRDEAGKLTGFVCIISDITQRKQAETALRESQQMLQLVLDTIPVRVFWKDRNSVFLGCNQAFARDAGLNSPSEVVGKTDFQVNFEQAELYRSDDRLVMETGQPKLNYEEPQTGADGRRSWLRTSKIPLRDLEKNIIGILGTYEDITEYKQAEGRVRQAQQAAEAANKAKDQFLAILSHELRTPLTPVLMTASSMQGDPALPQAVREAMMLIRQNVELEARLIDDLLDLNRVAQGKLALHTCLVDAHAKLHAVLEICRGDIEAKALQVVSELKATEYHVQADPGRIQQVFWNLIKNAIKFTPSGGTLTLRSYNRSCAWPSSGPDQPTAKEAAANSGQPCLSIEISDTGVGIEPETLPRLFKPFEQGDRLVTRRFGGLGLGLFICQTLVESHGGHIHVSSAGRGKGATFTVELPTCGACPAHSVETSLPLQPASEETHPVSRVLKILLVEDHEPTARVLQRLLTSLGHSVRAAGSIASAKAWADSHPLDLVISDLGLPDGTGLELMQYLRLKYHLPGVALSGFGMEEDLRKSQEAGFAEHLVKPVRFDYLQSAITRVMDNRPAPGPLI
ncbi:MAG TPA: PAS domain S-box protein [Tepidisphaeraceae bacterium]|nr:PAS domain S-box protein [Tepidisphaeraceae bacterium]